MHLHIAFAGKDPDPTLNAIKAIPTAIDEVVILYSTSKEGIYEKTAAYLMEKLIEMGYGCESRVIRAFDFLNIVDTIYDVYEKHTERSSGTKVSVDITNGTNLMAAAACNTAFFIGSDVYYMLDGRLPHDSLEELLITIPSPKIPDVGRLGELSLKMLAFIAREQDLGHEVCNVNVANEFGMKAQAVVYHIRRLIDAGLVSTEDAYTSKGRIDNRRKALKVNREGRFVLRWTGA